MPVPQAVFGPGSLYITRNDAAAPTPQTSYNVGYCNEFSYDESAENKELYGQNQYPLVIARGTVKATGKIKAATISGLALNAAVWGVTSFTTGQLLMVQGFSGSIPASTPFTLTPTIPGSGTFESDFGVTYAATGLPLEKVTSGPTTGQYSVATGVYTFAAADEGLGVLINLSYTTSTAGGQRLTVTNQPIGFTPTFQIDYVSVLNGVSYYRRFFNAVSTKLTMQHKLTDFVMPEIDFGFFANNSGQVFESSFANAA